MIKPEWHFMKDKPRLCSCINNYKDCCGKKKNTSTSTSTTSGDIEITYTIKNNNEQD